MNRLTHFLRRIWRAQLLPDAILTVEEVAEALPGRPEFTRSWVEHHVSPCGNLDGAALYRWGDVLVVLTPSSSEVARGSGGSETHERPLTSWRDVAAACGVSEDTLARRRRTYDPQAKPLFATRDEAWAWFASLGRVSPRRSSRPAMPQPTLASRTRG